MNGHYLECNCDHATTRVGEKGRGCSCRSRMKRQEDAYRTAAARLSGGRVHPMASVNQPASKDGAFVEVTVWVSQAEMEKERV